MEYLSQCGRSFDVLLSLSPQTAESAISRVAVPTSNLSGLAGGTKVLILALVPISYLVTSGDVALPHA